MFVKRSLLGLAAVSACAAVPAPAPAPALAPGPAPAPAPAATPAFVTVQNRYNYCLKLNPEGGSVIEWDHCDQAGVLLFRTPAPIGPLVSHDGQSCLTVYPSEPMGFPAFKMALCIGNGTSM